MRPRECAQTNRQTDAQTQTGFTICIMLCYIAMTMGQAGNYYSAYVK